MKRIVFRIMMGCLTLLMLLSPTRSYAAAGVTNNGAAERESVYVAGAPDNYPVESYDADSGAYVGATTEFLSLVEEKSDLSFVYIRAGEQDRREALAGNSQVDMFFALESESDLLKLGVEKSKLFSVTKDGKPTDVYCVFTTVSGERERTAIRSVSEGLTKDDVANLLTADSSELMSQRRFHIILIALGAAFLCTLVALTVFLVLFFRRRKKNDALVDSTTEVGNKKYFIQMFSTTISDQTRELYYIVHFAFAIDWVNRNFGTDKSDEILRYAADTIKQRLKNNEFCARIGGGSFAAAIYSNGMTQTERRVEEILRVLNAYGENNKSVEVNALFHAGVCALAIDDKSAEKVLYNADQAYHRAVELKKDYVFVNHDVLDEYKTKVSIREQAGEAIEHHEFTPYVQFIVNASDGAICGGELLSRWENRLYGLLTPGNYISILQDMGLIVRHDLLILEEACRLLEMWQLRGKNYFLTCNLTRVTISDKTIVDKIESIANKYKFPKEKLVLEVTEDSIEEDKDSALKNILTLKGKGYRVALDDFSTGYTAVSNIYEYAVELVKLDRRMISDADHDPQAAALIKEITELCHKLGIRVLAEGVETEEQVRKIKIANCDYMQGFFFIRALPLRELDGFESGYTAKTVSVPEGSDGASDVAEPVDAPAEIPDEEPAAALAKATEETPPEIGEKESAEIVEKTADGITEENPADTSEKPVEILAVVPLAVPVYGRHEAALKETRCAPGEKVAAVPEGKPIEIPAERPSGPAVEQQPETPVAVPAAVPAEPAATPVQPRAEVPAAVQQEEPKPTDAAEPAAAPVQPSAEVPAAVQREEPKPADAAEKDMLHIHFGQYRLDLPGNINIDSVSVILRAIQDSMN